MINPFIIISLLFLSFGFSQQEYHVNDLIEMDNGLWTEKFSDVPITVKVFSYYGQVPSLEYDKIKDINDVIRHLKKVYQGNFRNGKKEGKWVNYYNSTGRKSYEQNFKDGKLNGLHTTWYENGQKEQTEFYKDLKKVGKHLINQLKKKTL